MYATKEQTEAALLAANQIKKATLNAAKGLSRVQAERVAAAAARNVNAYGQKEEGPSRWQERKEAKRQMYLMSTERAVKLGVRKDNKTVTRENLRASVKCQQIQCQRCFQVGHWTFECTNERVYVSRPSRTQTLQNPAFQPLLEVSDSLPTTNTEVEVEIQQNFKSQTLATSKSNGNKSNRSPPRKSDSRNRKRRRSKKESSSESSESESSPSKSETESELSSSSSEALSSTTYSSSTMSSPSRTTSSSRKSSSCSSVDPPTPESESEDRPRDGAISMLTHPNSPAGEALFQKEDIQTQQQSYIIPYES